MKERDYQKEMRKSLYGLYRNEQKKVLMVAPTGAGKTVIAANIIKDATSRNRRVLFLIHRNTLASQTSETLAEYGIDSGFIISDMTPNPDALVQIASVQTLASRGVDTLEHFDLVVYDEAHIVAWSQVGREILERDCWHCGLTATPWRLSKKQHMTDLFPDTVYAPMPGELMDMGFLVKPRYFVLPSPDLSGVSVSTTGDYNEKELDWACNTPDTINHFVQNYLEKAKGLKTIIFCVTVSHANNVADALNAVGVRTAVVSGKTSQKQRDIIYNQLANGLIDAISSCDALSEGFNYRGIECVCLLRPTKSQAKYYQQLGRGLRIAPGKEWCIVLDQTNNTKSFGRAENLKIDECVGYVEAGNFVNCPTSKRVLYNTDLYWNDDAAFISPLDKENLRRCPMCAARMKKPGGIEGRCSGYMDINKTPVKCGVYSILYGGRCLDCMRLNYCSHSPINCSCDASNKKVCQCSDRQNCATKTPIGDLCQYHVQLSKPSLIATNQAAKMVEIGGAVTPQVLYQKWAREAYQKGWAPESASVKYNQRFNKWPNNELKRGAIFGANPTDDDRRRYIEYLQFVAEKKGKDRKWINSQYVAQFGEFLPQSYEFVNYL